MAVAFMAVTRPGLLSQQYPPPLLPKPGKDNARLQKLLKRTAKKKTSAQAVQSAAPFRSSLSPVNEASPDLEHSDHSTPPRTPETPSNIFGIQQPPRFTVRPLYQHVASPYPQRAAYGRAAKFSPQTVAFPSYSYSQHVTTVSSYSPLAYLSGVSPVLGPVAQQAIPKISLSPYNVPEVTMTAAEVKKPAFTTFDESHAVLTPAAAAATTPQSKPKSPGLTPYTTTGGQTMIRPLTVLTTLIKSKSPRPTFKATEPSKSPKPMFDVPQIRMYTASTSYYETSRTPPVYDTAELTAIGSTIPQNKIQKETKQYLTELKRNTTQTAQSPFFGTDPQRNTPTSEIKSTTTPTTEINTVVTPTPEIKRVTPTSEIKRATPTPVIKRVTPTPEIKRAKPTLENKRATPTSEIKRATPSPEIKSTYEFQTSRTSTGRPRTPAHNVGRATTPVFEISKANPLLFAVSPITVEPERSRTPNITSAMSSLSASKNVLTLDPKPSETILNGDIRSEVTPEAKPIQRSLSKSESEPALGIDKNKTAPAFSQRPQTPTYELTTSAMTLYSYQSPKTPTYEASRLMNTLPGYKRPKTPTGVSPVVFQRPKTPSQVAQKSKSAYRGLTPSEYAAYGGIKTFSPAFGISCSKTSTKEGVQGTREESTEGKTQSQNLSMKEPSEAEVFKVKETPKDVDKPNLRDVKFPAIPSIPIIVVSQASDTSHFTLHTSMVSHQITVKQDEMVAQEKTKTKPPTADVKTLEMVETTVPEDIKPKTPETKHPLSKGGDQDPLKAVMKLLDKDKVQTAEKKAENDTKDDLTQQKEPVQPITANTTEAGGSEPSSAAPAKAPAVQSTESKDEGKNKATEPAIKTALDEKEGSESLTKAESHVEVIQKPKGVKSKLSGWSRLKKHMVVEQEEPKFPGPGSWTETTGQDQNETKKAEKADDMPGTQDKNHTKDAPKATMMWDAVLFQMFSTKENILHQIEINKNEEEKTQEPKDELKEIPTFAYRLPVLLFSPKFDAKRLKEAASRPMTKISTVFEMGLIGRKGKEEEPKDFNRTARGFAAP